MEKIFIAGYGGSGSSAVFDLIKEIDIVRPIDAELRFISDPDGILSLHRAFDKEWSPYVFDLAVRRYLSLIRFLNKKYTKRYSGLNLNTHFNGKLIDYTYEYVSKLSSNTFKGIWFGIASNRLRLIHKLSFKYGLPLRGFFEDIHLKSDVSFKEVTNEYFSVLLKEVAGEISSNQKYLIDEPYCSLYLEEMSQLFDDAKFITVVRDPRDLYVNAKKYGFTFIPSSPESFTEWYNNLITCKNFNYSDSERVLRIRFEDLILEYESEKSKIFSFLGIENVQHIRKFKYLNPDKSKKNIGLWRSFAAQDEIKYITDHIVDIQTLYPG